MRYLLCLALASAPALASDSDADPALLPDPPPDVTALALAEYQRGAQAFADGDYAAAERAFRASWRYQRNHVTLYDLALVHIRQRRYEAAADDMVFYFSWAPSPDANRGAAMARFERIARLRHLKDRSGRRCAAPAIDACRAGRCDSPTLLDECLAKTQDPALVYWLVLYDYGPALRERLRVPVAALDDAHRRLAAYFAAAEDRSDLFDALHLDQEIEKARQRESILEARAQRAKGGQ